MKINRDNPKIIFVVHSFHISGALTQSLVLAKHFKDTGYDVLVIGKRGKYGDRLFKKCGIRTLFSDAKTPDGVRDLGFAINVKLMMCESLFSYEAFTGVSGLFPESSKVLRVHEEISEELLKKGLWQGALKIPIQEVFDRFELTIFPSNHTAEFYSQKIGHNAFSVIPITINNEDAHNVVHKKDKVFRILQLGTVYERKNPIFTLIAFEKFLSKYAPPKAELIFVGARSADKNEIDYIRKLRAEIKARKLSGKVKIVKTSMSPEKYISKASVVTLHSLSECTPTVYLEANHLGKYVVGSVVGGVSEIVKNGVNGYLFDYGDTDEQADLFGKIYEENPLSAPNKDLQKYYYDNFSNKLFFARIEESLKIFLHGRY